VATLPNLARAYHAPRDGPQPDQGAVAYDGGVTGTSRRAETALCVASLVLSLTAAELGVRLTGSGDRAPTGYAPVNTGRASKQRLNSAGFRDRERSLKKPPGVLRVVCLGDSFAWGHGVELEDAFPYRLEGILNRRHSQRYEVVNLALPGMNTVDEASQLEEKGFAYQPDLVLLAYVLNDSEDPEAAEARRARDWSEPVPPPVLGRSALFRWIQRRLWATAESRRRVSGYLSMYREDAPGWVAGQKALRQIGESCWRRGVPWLVVIFPLFGNPLDQSYPFAEIHAKVAQAARAAGAQVLDLWPAFRGLHHEILVVDGVDDEHPNEVAQRIAAGQIRPVVEALLPSPEQGAR